MRAQDLDRLLAQRPFVPVRLYMTDGTSYDIGHPEAVIISRSSAAVGTGKRLGLRAFDQMTHLNLIQIVRVVEVKNGHGRRRRRSAKA